MISGERKGHQHGASTVWIAGTQTSKPQRPTPLMQTRVTSQTASSHTYSPGTMQCRQSPTAREDTGHQLRRGSPLDTNFQVEKYSRGRCQTLSTYSIDATQQAATTETHRGASKYTQNTQWVLPKYNITERT